MWVRHNMSRERQVDSQNKIKTSFSPSKMTLQIYTVSIVVTMTTFQYSNSVYEL